MGISGPLPENNAEGILKGNKRAIKRAKNEMAMAQKQMPPLKLEDFQEPEHLPSPYKEEFDTLVNVLRRRNDFRGEYVRMIARYVWLLSKHDMVREDIDKNGMTYDSETAKGELRRNIRPEVTIEKNLSTELRTIESKFGFDPYDYLRIASCHQNNDHPDAPKSDIDKYLDDSEVN